jgi:hypothetical protein
VSQFDGITCRLRRADLHIKALKKMIDGFTERNPHVHVIKPYHEVPFDITVDIGDYRVAPSIIHDRLPDGRSRLRGTFVDEFGIILDVRDQIQVDDFTAIVGDVIHNQRTILDHIAWGLSERFSGPAPPDPIPAKDHWRSIYFPVEINPLKWTATAARCLWAVDPTLITRFERLQPFYRNRKFPEQHWLAMLNELWNRDKHRSALVTNSLVALNRVNPADWHYKAVPGGEPVKDMQAHVLKRRKVGPVENGAELARIRVLSEGTTLDGLRDAMEMDLVFAYDVAFQEGPPGFGKRVILTLEDFQGRVTAIISRFKSELI